MSQTDKTGTVMEYLMVIQQEPEGYSAHFPDAPGCFTQGDTLEELYANAQEALELYLDTLRDMGKPLPKPSTQVGKIAVKAS